MASTTKLLESIDNGIVFPNVSVLDQEPELGNTYRVKVKFVWLPTAES